MEKKIIEEQSKEEQAIKPIETNKSADSDFDSSTKGQEEEFGGFKNHEDLVNAYENLRKEFTRKCQRLSELEKDKTQENNPSDQDFSEELSAFLLKNNEATDYKEELLQKVSSSVSSNFENAWAKIVLERIASDNVQKMNDPLVKKVVFEDENIKNSVIEIYMKELQSKKPPILLKSEQGQTATRLEPVAPTSLKQAKKLVEDMFS